MVGGFPICFRPPPRVLWKIVDRPERGTVPFNVWALVVGSSEVRIIFSQLDAPMIKVITLLKVIGKAIAQAAGAALREFTR